MVKLDIKVLFKQVEFLVLVGENHVNHSNNNNTIAAFINNFAGGSVTIAGTTGGGSCGNDCNITQTNTDVYR